MSEPLKDVHRNLIAAMTAYLADDDLAPDLLATLVYDDPELTIPACIGALTTLVGIAAHAQDSTPQDVWQTYAALIAEAHAADQTALDKENP